MKELSIEEKAKVYDEAYKKVAVRFGSNVADEIFPELKESEDEKVRRVLREIVLQWKNGHQAWCSDDKEIDTILAWLEKQDEQNIALPKWKYKNDNIPLLRDSIILNKYGCVGKSPSGALVSDVWVMDYNELAKLPKEEFKKQGEHKPNPYSGTSFEYNGHTWGMCARDNGVEILIDGHLKGRVFTDDSNAKEMFIKALERVEEQNAKGYKLTDCDKNSWWEDFKVYSGYSKHILSNSAKTC